MYIRNNINHTARIAALLCMALFCYCTSKRHAEKSYDKLYKRSASDIEASFVLYHYSDEDSRVYYTVDTKDLVYKKTDSSGWYTATLKLSYQLIPDPDSRLIIDSGSFVINDKTKGNRNARISGYIFFKCQPSQQERFLELQLSDQQKKVENRFQLSLNKQAGGSAQDFLIKDQDSLVLMNNHIRMGTSVSIEQHRRPDDPVIVEFFKADSKLPPPPFNDAPYVSSVRKCDTLLKPFLQSTNSMGFTFRQSGIYVLRSSKCLTGHALFVSEGDFPKVSTHQQMIAATRYILNREEYTKLMEAADKKKAIEQYWIGVSGSMDRARELIRKYYGRVEQANVLFTAAEEGWKTDRGMIYIVFGAPEKVYKTSTFETWVYGQDGVPGAVIFKFDKVLNQFSDNDFYLNRSPQLKDPWYMAVDAWREGRIHSDN